MSSLVTSDQDVEFRMLRKSVDNALLCTLCRPYLPCVMSSASEVEHFCVVSGLTYIPRW